jgi:hypothetical protein
MTNEELPLRLHWSLGLGHWDFPDRASTTGAPSS